MLPPLDLCAADQARFGAEAGAGVAAVHSFPLAAAHHADVQRVAHLDPRSAALAHAHAVTRAPLRYPFGTCVRALALLDMTTHQTPPRHKAHTRTSTRATHQHALTQARTRVHTMASRLLPPLPASLCHAHACNPSLSRRIGENLILVFCCSPHPFH